MMVLKKSVELSTLEKNETHFCLLYGTKNREEHPLGKFFFGFFIGGALRSTHEDLAPNVAIGFYRSLWSVDQT